MPDNVRPDPESRPVLLTYLQRFSPDLTDWKDSNAAPTVLADDGSNEVVSLPFPANIRGGTGFFQLDVRITP